MIYFQFCFQDWVFNPLFADPKQCQSEFLDAVKMQNSDFIFKNHIDQLLQYKFA